MPKLAVVSGKAGGLQAMLPMLRLFEASPRWYSIVYLCDQHWYDPCPTLSDTPPVALLDDCGSSRVEELLNAHADLVSRLIHLKPDVVMVYGDRLDALLGATVAHELRIPVAHLQAGDLTGGIDNRNRYATSLLSRWLFCSNIDAQARLNWLFHIVEDLLDGPDREEYDAIVVGDHHTDAVLEIAAGRRHESNPCAPVIVHLHPDTLLGRIENADLVIEAVDCVDGREAIYLPPCRDLHHEAILNTYKDLGIRTTPIMPLSEFVPLLLSTPLFIGNSSALLIDAPTLGVPTMLLGNRQRGRKPFVGDGRAGQRTFDFLDNTL